MEGCNNHNHNHNNNNNGNGNGNGNNNDTLQLQLRFNLDHLTVTDIANLLYYPCEKFLEYGYLYGKEDTFEMEVGRFWHDEIARNIGFSLGLGSDKDINELIRENNSVLVNNVPLSCIYNNVKIVGIADTIYFRDGMPKMLYEYKFSKNDRLHLAYNVQAQLYCHMLCQRYGINDISYRIIIFNTKELGKDDYDNVVNLAKTLLYDYIPDRLRKKVKIYPNRYNQYMVQRYLDYALEFWLGKRTKTSDSVDLCIRCKFREECVASLFK